MVTLLFVWSDPAKQSYHLKLRSVDETLHLLKSRRSIFPKDYNGKLVPDEDIMKLLDAGNWAPTHGMTQPWRWVVMRGKTKEMEEFLTISFMEQRKACKGSAEKLEEAEKKIKRKEKELANCSHLIAIVQKKVQNAKGFYMPDWEETAAVACAVQNMHIMATSMGIAGYWSSGGYDTVLASTDMRNFLGLQEGDKCLGLFHIGYSDKTEGYRSSRSPLEGKVVWKSAYIDQVYDDNDDDDDDD